MSKELWGSLGVYVLIMAFTPGPNNLLSLTNAAAFGFKKTLPMLMGLLSSFLVLMGASGAATSLLAEAIPRVLPLLRILGTLYILWLSYAIARSREVKERLRASPCGFWGAVLVNTLNVKVLLYGVTTYTTFVLPVTADVLTIVLVALLLALAASAANFTWALAGDALKSAFSRHPKAINRTLALCLAASVLSFYR